MYGRGVETRDVPLIYIYYLNCNISWKHLLNNVSKENHCTLRDDYI
jgi:hypothetical protein